MWNAMRGRGAMAAVVGLACLVSPASSMGQEEIFGRAVGSFTISDPGPAMIVGELNQFFIETQSSTPISFLVMQFEFTPATPDPGVAHGTFTIIGDNPADTLSAIFDGVLYTGDATLWRSGGTWSATGGTGAFAGVTGSGEYAAALFTETGDAGVTVSGSIVPALSTGVLMTLGGGWLCRRRRV